MSKGIPAGEVEKEYAKQFIANGMNSTQAYIAVKKTKNIKSARVQATRMLAKPSVQQHIRELLPSQEETVRVIKDVYTTPREKQITFRDLHKYLETDLKLRGYLSTQPQGSNVNVAFIVNKATDKP